MIIFSFKRCASEAEAKKVKKIYLIASIVLFLITGITIGIISEKIYKPLYGELSKFNSGKIDVTQIEQLVAESQEISRKFFPFSIIFQLATLYLTVWASLKLGIGKFASFFLGILIFFPLLYIVPFVVILTRKFSPPKIK